MQLIVFSLKGYKTIEYAHNTTRPGQEIAVAMTQQNVENVELALVGKVGGVTVRSCGVVAGGSCGPRQIAQDFWWWLTGR